MAESVNLKRNASVRTCSVCNIVEIDKTTAYTKTGEQKPQGRRCVACVDGAKPEAPAAKKVATKKLSAVAKPKPAAVPDKSNPVTPEHPSESNGEGDSSMTKYAIGAVIIAVVIWLVLFR